MKRVRRKKRWKNQGYYLNRSNLIYQEIRQQSSLNFRWFYGVMTSEKEEQLKAKEQQRKMKIRNFGLLGIDDELDDLEIKNVESIAVKGKVICSDRIKKSILVCAKI